jgi:uroporphyrinogen-III synthase
LVAEFPDYEPGTSGPPGTPGTPGNLVLFACAEEAPFTIAEGLGEKGWEVRRIHAYRTVALPPPEGWLLDRMAHADAVTFAASSSATAYAALKGSDGGPLPVPPLVICMGPTTARDARALGMTGVEEADGPSSEGIVAALARNLAHGS